MFIQFYLETLCPGINLLHKKLPQSILVHYYISLAEISCGIPANGTNTQAVPQDSLIYNNTYSYSCLTGYTTTDVLTVECLSDGTLSLHTPPNCTSKHFLCVIYK